MKKWRNYTQRFLNVTPWHGIGHDGACTCGIGSCLDPGAHPLNEYAQELYDEGKLPANLAIVPSGDFIVLEVQQHGRGKWADLKASHKIEKTWVSTGIRGEWFIFFKKPAARIDLSLGDGVMMRDSEFLAPPSLLSDGKRLKWLVAPWDCDLGPLPASLLVAVTKSSTARGYDPASAVRDSAVRMFIRRMFLNQEGKLDGEPRREKVREQAVAFNEGNCPSIETGEFMSIVESVIAECEIIPPPPKEAVDAAEFFGGEVVDHLSYRE